MHPWNLWQQTGKLACWLNMLAEVDLEIFYRPGRTNSNADTLPRPPMEEATGHYKREVANISASSTNEQSTTEIATLQHAWWSKSPANLGIPGKERTACRRKESMQTNGVRLFHHHWSAIVDGQLPRPYIENGSTIHNNSGNLAETSFWIICWAFFTQECVWKVS